jgi:rhamnogalacturonyl hydrolase YesR
MKRKGFVLVLLLNVLLSGASVCASEPELPTRSEVISVANRVNVHWIDNHASPGNNEWTRAAYFVGNLELYKASQKKKYLTYTLAWANNNKWAVRDGISTSNADNHAAGQIYLDLYLMDETKVPSRIAAIKEAIDYWIDNYPQSDRWWWADALFMAMPTIARLGAATNEDQYYEKLYALFRNTRDTLIVNSSNTYLWSNEYRMLYGEGPIVSCPDCGNDADGLYNKTDKLWYRDWRYQPGVPPGYDWYSSGKTVEKESPNGKNIYWSRGNGWVFAALARTLQCLPETDAHRQEYVDMFVEMAAALKNCQRTDGFWNMNLGDPDHYPAPETSGTGFFTYGLAWGVNNGLLDRNAFYPVVARAWNGLAETAIQTDGNVRYTQNVQERPVDPSRLTTQSVDFGVGAVLLAASEVSRLAFDDGLPPDDDPDLPGSNDVLLDRSDWEITCSSPGPVDESVAIDGDYPGYILDGDNVTAFLFVKPGATYGRVSVPAGVKPYFTIDLKQAQEINCLYYRHRDYGNTTPYLRASKASFYGSDSGEDDDWQPLIENFDIAVNETEVRVEFPKAVCRYVKFVMEAWYALPQGNTIQVSEFNLGNSALETGIKAGSLLADSPIGVYPNPAKAGQAFTIDLGDAPAESEIRIFSVSGTKQVERKTGGRFIRQTLHRQGVYIIEVKKNQQVYLSKIIIN